MSDPYQLNVRFDLDDEAERHAAEYLAGLNKADGKSRNRFVVEAVVSYIDRQNKDRDFTLDDIRQVLREELRTVSFAAPIEKNSGDLTLTEEQQAENDESVLADLSAFFS